MGIPDRLERMRGSLTMAWTFVIRVRHSGGRRYVFLHALHADCSPALVPERTCGFFCHSFVLDRPSAFSSRADASLQPGRQSELMWPRSMTAVLI
jgi:hypothetical protein